MKKEKNINQKKIRLSKNYFNFDYISNIVEEHPENLKSIENNQSENPLVQEKMIKNDNYYNWNPRNFFEPESNQHYQNFREEFYDSHSSINRYKARTLLEKDTKFSYYKRVYLDRNPQVDSNNFLKREKLLFNPIVYGEFQKIERDSSVTRSRRLKNVHINHFDGDNLRINYGGFKKFF